MKIKELHLRNIASIEKADIDFENSLYDGITGEPAGIFLIAGDTGAGKSVILDGIAMALYKNTPRIAGVANTNKNNFNNDEGESIRVNSIEQYTRLGISVNDECYSEVVFTGNDGLEYHARLTLGIYKGRTDKETGLRPILYRDPSWEVKIGENDWTKVGKDGQPILNAVGLTFEQFGRMAMLAQGQFASFLTGDKKERESILEQLTNTAHFTQYGNAIKSLFDKAKASKSEVQTAYDIEKQHILSPEDYNQYETEYKEKGQSKGELEKKKAFNEEQLKHLNDIVKQQKNKSEAQTEVKVQEEIIARSTYRSKKDLITLWDKTVEQRLWLNEWKSQQIQAEKTSAEIGQSQKTFSTLSADFQYRKEEQQQLDEQLNQSKEWLEERKEKDSLYTHAGEYKLKLESFITNQKAISDKEDSIQKLETDKPSLNTALNEATTEADDAKKAVDKQQVAIEQLTKEREQLNPTQIAKDFELTNKRKNALEALRTDFENLDNEKKTTDELKEKIAKDEEQFEKLKGEKEKAEDELALADDRAKKAQNLLSTMKMSVEETLINLRKKLHEQAIETCPLCGQKIQNLKVDDEFKNLLTPLQAEQQTADEEFKKKEEASKVINKQHNTLQGQLIANKELWQQKDNQNRQKETTLNENANQLGIDISMDWKEQMASTIFALEKKLSALKESLSEAEKLQTSIQAFIQQKNSLDKAHIHAQNKKTQAENNLKNNQDNIERINKEVKDLFEKQADLRNDLDEILARHYPTWEKDCSATIGSMMEEAQNYIQKKQENEKLEKEYNNRQTLIENIGNIYHSILADYPDWNTIVVSKPHECRDILSEWNNLYGKIKAQKELISLCKEKIEKRKQQLDEYQQSTGISTEQLSEIDSKQGMLKEAREFIQTTDTKLQSRKDAIATADKQIQEAMEKLGITDMENLHDKTALEESIKENQRIIIELVEEMGAIKNKLDTHKTNEKKLAELAEQLEALTRNFNKWDKLNNIFGGTRFRTLVQTYILRPLLNNANIYLEKITDRYVLTCSEDNEQLSILVLDRYNKNQIRSVTVLSGGERFMISLALSLALSSLNRPDMNINILFIDEGFGTLDEKSLDSVMNTLEKLQDIAGQNNRRVGIISHREELDERIPVQIRVIKKGEGRSHVEIKNS